MAYGKIIADQIQHSSEGTVDTQYVVNGSSKHWIHLVGTGTISTLDSFNSSSATDIATGRYQTNFSNNMNNVNYAVASADQYQTSGFYDPTTSNHKIFINTSDPRSAVDSIVSQMLQGDLA